MLDRGLPDAAELLAALNPPQRRAVTVGGGPVLVLAGPGSGKTRVLTHRIAYLIAVVGVEPWRIMAVTFTNKAAREMRHRVAGLLGSDTLGRLTLGTFHAICARILRQEAAVLGHEPDFVIYDQSDQLQLIKRCFEELDIDPDHTDPRSVLAAIGRAKNELVRAGDYTSRSYFEELVARTYLRYQALLRASNALDFDDLLLETAEAFQRQPEIRQRYRQRYRHVLVDEFQDTNTAQYVIVKALAAAEVAEAEHNLFVVGDEDQSIYSWRGADYRNLERFRSDFPDAQVVLLEQNYRSTQTILDAARAVIDCNPRRTPKRLWSEGSAGTPIALHAACDAEEEAAYVVGEIQRALRSGARPGDHAAMYRTNAQSRPLEEALVAHAIPYQLVGATRFYDRREVKDVLAYLRLAHNPYDEVALSRVINVPPRGIGARSLQTLLDLARATQVPQWTALGRIALDDPSDEVAQIDRRLARGLVAFHDLVGDLVEARDRLTPAQLLEYCLERSGYGPWLRDGTDEGEERWENIVELGNVAAETGGDEPGQGLEAVLEFVALVTDVDNLAEGADRVTVLTLHSAKGLEFDTVYLVGLEDGLLPHGRSLTDPDAMAEERRLFYVGMTRACRRLVLTFARCRAVFGRIDTREPSRFLRDIPADLLRSTSAAGRRAAQPHLHRHRDTSWPPGPGRPTRHDERPDPAPSGLRPGDRVRHASFGEGMVVATRALPDDEEVTVAFDSGGLRKLLASYVQRVRT